MQSVEKKALGRGLASLFSQESSLPLHNQTIPSIQEISLHKIHPGRSQPRTVFSGEALRDLAESIKEKGVLQPILVRPLKGGDEKYEIVAGERRWRAAQIANLEVIPAVIKDIPDNQALETALIENIQRENLTAIEEAEAYQRLIEEFGYTQEKLSLALGKSRSHVANTLRLNKLPEEIKSLIAQGLLSAGHARALLNASNIQSAVQDVLRKNLNVRQTEQLARNNRLGTNVSSSKDADLQNLERQLAAQFGGGVSIYVSEKGDGQIKFTFESLQQLDALTERLLG